MCFNMDTVTFSFSSRPLVLEGRGSGVVEDLLALPFSTLGKILVTHLIRISEVEESVSLPAEETP